MLKGIDKILTGELLKVLCEMGHGDELVIADANYPADTMGETVIRYPGVDAVRILNAVLDVFPLDHISEYAAAVLDLEEKDKFIMNGEPPIWREFENTLQKKSNVSVRTLKVPRQEFYERSKKASVIIQTGEERLYGDLLLIKGVI